MKKLLVALVFALFIIACAPAQEPTDAKDVADEVAKQDMKDTEDTMAKDMVKEPAPEQQEQMEPEVGRTPPKQTPPSTKVESQPPVETAPKTDMDPQIRDLMQRAEEKIKNIQYIYGGTSTGNLFLDTYMVMGDKVKIKKFEEDNYVLEGYYDTLYLNEGVACCEVQNRCKSHNVDNTNKAFEIDAESIKVPTTPYQWVKSIPANAKVVGPQTFDERSVTYITWTKDGLEYKGWFDDTYGIAHKVEIYQGEDLVEKHQYNDLVFNNLKEADFVPACQ